MAHAEASFYPVLMHQLLSKNDYIYGTLDNRRDRCYQRCAVHRRDNEYDTSYNVTNQITRAEQYNYGELNQLPYVDSGDGEMQG